VLVGQFAEGYSYDVLPGLYMAVHARGYSATKHKYFKGTLNLWAASRVVDLLFPFTFRPQTGNLKQTELLME